MQYLFFFQEGVEIVYDYHRCQMMLQVNYFLYKPEAVGSYWLRKVFLRVLSTILFSLCPCKNVYSKKYSTYNKNKIHSNIIKL
jgi:hypothetical protein